MTRVTRVAIALAALLLVAVGASGAWLWWNYRPDRDNWIRVVHQGAAIALLALAVVLVVLAIVRRARAGAAGIVAAVGVFVTVGAAFVLGRLMAWDQLALAAIVDRDHFPLGAAATFDDRVKFVIVRGREVTASTYRAWSIAHVVLGALAVVALVLVWLRTRGPERGISRGARPPAPAAEPAD